MKIDVNEYYNVTFKDIEDRICDINLKGSELINQIKLFLDYADLVNVIFGFNMIIFNYETSISIDKIILHFKEV